MKIIGAGRVGGALAAAAADRGVAVDAIDRATGWEHLASPTSDPILVCTNPDDLLGVIERVPSARKPDLAFVQNGMIDSFLIDHRLDDCTRGLLYFAVPSRGMPVQPGGASIFTGPHAPSIVNWFHAIGLEARCVDRQSFTAEMVEKLIWNCIFGLLGTVKGAPVGSLVSRERDAIDALVNELVAVSDCVLGTRLDAGPLGNRLCAYSMTIPDYTGSLKQLRWRNGWFAAAAEQHGVATPVHDAFLRDAGAAAR